MTDRSLKDQLQNWKKDQSSAAAKSAAAAAEQARARAPRAQAKKKAPTTRPPDVIRRDAPPDPRTAPPPPPKTDRQLLEEAADAVTAGAVLEKFAALPEGQKKPQLPPGAILDDAALFARFTDGAKPLAAPDTTPKTKRAPKKP